MTDEEKRLEFLLLAVVTSCALDKTRLVYQIEKVFSGGSKRHLKNFQMAVGGDLFEESAGTTLCSDDVAPVTHLIGRDGYELTGSPAPLYEVRKYETCLERLRQSGGGFLVLVDDGKDVVVYHRPESCKDVWMTRLQLS